MGIAILLTMDIIDLPFRSRPSSAPNARQAISTSHTLQLSPLGLPPLKATKTAHNAADTPG